MEDVEQTESSQNVLHPVRVRPDQRETLQETNSYSCVSSALS